MSKFIVTLDVGTREQRNAITAMFQAKGWQQWHWLEDVWLLAEVPPSVTSRALSEEISNNPLIGPKAKLVIKLPDDAHLTHWGNASKDGWDWMAKFWGNAG